uniref:Uncharacterized protein n=2 Tax=Ciona intestinalis TaxID=7719 RepID=F6UGZ6_CIOIN
MLFILYWMIRSSRHNHQDRISGGKFPALLFVALLVSLAAYTNGYEGEGGILHSNHLHAKQIATRRVNTLFMNNINVKQGEKNYQKTYAEFTKFRKSLSRNNAQDTKTLELLFRHRRQRRGTRELPFEISEGDSGVAGNSFANRFPSPSEGNQASTSTFPPRDFIREPLLPPVEYPYGPNTNMSGTMDSFNHSSRYNFLSIWNISRPTDLSPPL